MTLTGLIRVSIIVPLIFALSAISAKPARAQDSQTTPDLQQLNNKLEQLEKELEEVKSQMRAAAAAEKPSKAQAPQGQAEARKTSAESAPVVAIPSQAPVTPPQAGTVPMEGEITERQDSVDFYGFVMLDSGYDFGQVNPNWYDVVRPTKLPSYANQFAPSGNVYAGVRQTRFGVKSSTPTKFGDLNTIFEFELFGTGVDAGQTTFRLRHAYGELGQIGAGQTWSPFMDIGVFPNTLEYWGPSGMVFFRNVQLRWMPTPKQKRWHHDRSGKTWRQRRPRHLCRPHRTREHSASIQFPGSLGECADRRKLGLLSGGRHCSENRLG